MDKISIIIPVYNVEPYIKRCLDSVINQTYTNLEILCVDDGSTDRSGDICDEYAEKDSRIKVFHKSNSGVSSARNVGLQNFTGQYVGFVDSDDWLELDMYEILYEAIKSNNVSISVASYSIDTDMTSVPRVNLQNIPQGKLNSKEMLLYTFRIDAYRGFDVGIWNKLYSADIFLNNTLSFDINIRHAEDIIFLAQILLTDKCSGVYIYKPLYHYYQRNSSATHSNSVITQAESLGALNIVVDLLLSHRQEEASIWVKRLYCFYASLFAEKAINNHDKELLVRMQEAMKTYLHEYLETNKEFPDRIERINGLLATIL